MGKGEFMFSDKQRELILKMEVDQMIELFSITNKNIADFLYALKKQQKNIILLTSVFHLSDSVKELEIGIHEGVLSYRKERQWQKLGENYRILGIYLSEHLNKNPFLFIEKPERKKPKVTIIDLFFEMSLSELGRTKVNDILSAEVIPPTKERALRKALDKAKPTKQYSVGEIFTKMPLSRVGNLTLSQFFGAEVFGKGKKQVKMISR